MRLFMCVLLIVAVSATAVSSRIGGTGNPNPWDGKGSYDVMDIMAGELPTSYGMAIKDNLLAFCFEDPVSGGNLSRQSFLCGMPSCDAYAWDCVKLLEQQHLLPLPPKK